MTLLGTIGKLNNQELTNMLYVEQSIEDRKFNLNDIMGNVDIDGGSGKILNKKRDSFGNYIDRDGIQINQFGYCVDVMGNIIDKHTDKILFKRDDLTTDGDISAVFKIEGGNFSPFDVIGDVQFDEDRKPISTDLKDLKGRSINKAGYLIDDDGNIIDREGKRKILKENLTKKGEIPSLFTYEGNQFRIKDVIGDFDRETIGTYDQIIFGKSTEPSKTSPNVYDVVLKDKEGRRVNEKGYLVDEDGNIINRQNEIVIPKKYLNSTGEIPKMFTSLLFKNEDFCNQSVAEQLRAELSGNFEGKHGEKILPESI